MLSSANQPHNSAGEDRRVWLSVWAALAIVTLLAIYRLHGFPALLSWSAAFAGVREVIASTGVAALRVWLFWALSTVILGACIVRLDPAIELFDATLIGWVGLWVLAPIIGNLLGPIGLLNGATVWGLLALAIAWAWRSLPAMRPQTPSTGQKLALLTTGLLAVSYLPLQLASPVVPFMDVLSYPASVQRILTFHSYLPFDNDPYGCWGRYAVTPYLELFYTILAVGSGTKPAVLAESAAMMPMAALMIFAAYRLGKSIFNDTAGGIASLLLFATCLFRRAQGMRGTAVAFALVGLGLAFFLDPRRRRISFAAGAAMLGAAVGSHAIDGAFALIAGAIGLVLWLVEGDFNGVVAGVIALAGATFYAIPELLIGLNQPVRYPVLPMLLLAGAALIVGSALMLRAGTRSAGEPALRSANIAFIAALLLLVLGRHALVHNSLFERIAANLPILFLFSAGGLAAALWMVISERGPASRYVAIAAIPLLLGVFGDLIDPALNALGHTASSRMMTSDIGIKLYDYWCPYFLIFPAALLFALAYERWSAPLAMGVLLVILIYPWRFTKDPVYFDSLEHAISEQWAFNLDTAAKGYWISDHDRRWKFDQHEMKLIELLDSDIEAGRITPATHILHLTDTASSWSMVQFSVLTGINDDPIEYQHDPNDEWQGGGRVRGFDGLNAAIAAHPPYVLIQQPIMPERWSYRPPAEYDLVYARYPVRLFRRHDLAAVHEPLQRGPLAQYGLGLVLAVGAILVWLKLRSRSAELLLLNEGAVAGPPD